MVFTSPHQEKMRLPLQASEVEKLSAAEHFSGSFGELSAAPAVHYTPQRGQWEEVGVRTAVLMSDWVSRGHSAPNWFFNFVFRQFRNKSCFHEDLGLPGSTSDASERHHVVILLN